VRLVVPPALQDISAAVQHMSDSVFLVFRQADGRVHTTESYASAVVFTGTGAVHFLIVLADQSLAAVRVFPNPVFESVPDRLLLLGGQGGLFEIGRGSCRERGGGAGVGVGGAGMMSAGHDRRM